MIALSTVLSLFKLAEMPYGGSVTLASMLPMIIISYRHGIFWGLGAGSVYAAIQQLLGLNNLSYVTGWQSVLAVIMLDYMLAFMATSLGGVFRGKLKSEGKPKAFLQSREIALGAFLCCVVRYLFHTVAGATVWKGLSIPTQAALVYSIGYNATYMIPETVVNVAVAIYIGGIIEFTKNLPTRFSSKDALHKFKGVSSLLPYISAFLVFGAVITDAVLIFPHLQNAENGEFTFAHIAEAPWVAVAVITAVCLLLSLVSLLWWKIAVAKEQK